MCLLDSFLSIPVQWLWYVESTTVGAALASLVALSLLVRCCFSTLMSRCASMRAESPTGAHCSSADCVRCNRYKELLASIPERFEEFRDSVAKSGSTHIGLSRIERFVRNSGLEVHHHDQDFLNAKSTYGTSSSSYVLFIPDLEARCWHDTKSELVNAVNSGGFCRSEVLDQLRGEFHAAFFDSKACWQANNTKGVKAGWRTLYLVNQGQPVKEHIALCPKTAAALECVGAGLMRNCVFANACFSVLEPGAHIARHRGPCNVRIRCHVPLYCPDQCWLRVGDERRFWSELYSSTANGFFLFDDAFEHEVQHTGLEQDGARVIFMFDLWHPDLLEVERQAISYICSPWLDEAKAS